MKTKNTTTSMNYTPGTAPVYNWNDINEPGTYLFVEWGTLCRVPFDGVADGRSPRVTFFSNIPIPVVKLSDDPYIPISKARQLAADNDLCVNF
jgi:hypothetical protein